METLMNGGERYLK